jgi:hypothetical protein
MLGQWRFCPAANEVGTPFAQVERRAGHATFGLSAAEPTTMATLPPARTARRLGKRRPSCDNGLTGAGAKPTVKSLPPDRLAPVYSGGGLQAARRHQAKPRPATASLRRRPGTPARSAGSATWVYRRAAGVPRGLRQVSPTATSAPGSLGRSPPTPAAPFPARRSRPPGSADPTKLVPHGFAGRPGLIAGGLHLHRGRPEQGDA